MPSYRGDAGGGIPTLFSVCLGMGCKDKWFLHILGKERWGGGIKCLFVCH